MPNRKIFFIRRDNRDADSASRAAAAQTARQDPSRKPPAAVRTEAGKKD